MKKMMKFSILLLLISGIVVSCAEKGIQESAETNLPQDKEYERALELVKNFESSWGQTRAAGDEIYLLNTACENVGIPKEVQQTLTRSQDKAQPDSVKLYRFEFEKNSDKGFAISVGDERVNAILCYVERGSIDDTLYNEAMAEYISNLKYAVYNRLEENEKPAVETKANPTKLEKGPLLNVQWGQNWPYNYSCEYKGCTEKLTNGRFILGCQAVAVAQILPSLWAPKIENEFPKIKEWAKVKDFYEFHSDLVDFSAYMYYIATQLNTKFGCGGSSASTKSVHNFLDKYSIPHLWKTSNNLDVNQAIQSIYTCSAPVICIGFTKRRRGHGHSWVIEGYRGTASFTGLKGANWEASKNQPQYWYCNWGWKGYGDGWYMNYSHPKKSGNDSGDQIDKDFHYRNDFIYFFNAYLPNGDKIIY